MQQKTQWTIRRPRENEVHLLDDFLYEAIYIPEGMEPPERSIIQLPELQVYVANFGGRDDHALLADVNGQVAGAVWTRIMDDYGHIDDKTPSLAIAVFKDFRRRGIGSALLQEMIRLLSDVGYLAVSLSVQKANPAVRLYERHGFRKIRETTEELIMRRKLP